MKCTKCGAEVARNARFCGVCGNVLSQNKIELNNQRVCNNCGNPINDNVMFCGKCGHIADEISHNIDEYSQYPIDGLDVTTKMNRCPNCGEHFIDGFNCCPKCGFSQSGAINNNEQFQASEDKPFYKDKSVIALFVILILVIVGCATAIGVVVVKNTFFDDIDDPSTESSIVVSSHEGSVNSTLQTQSTVLDNDDNNQFEYKFDSSKVVANPTYQTVMNSNFSYKYITPNHFINKEFNYNRNVYYAPDNSAILSFEGYENSRGVSVQQSINEFKTEHPGRVVYVSYDEDWYAISIEQNGIYYYRKCFVDHYVRYFDMSYPAEYNSVYDKYINDIEDNFLRTDI